MTQADPHSPPVAMTFTVNGRAVSLAMRPDITLADMLRDELQLTGTKIGCASGECGACTVIVDGAAMPACITPALLVQGAAIQTVEGLTAQNDTGKDDLHPLQRAFIDNGAFQCGFCTAGMLMSATALLQRNPHPDEAAIRTALQGNICRCTGYVQILEAIRAVAAP